MDYRQRLAQDLQGMLAVNATAAEAGLYRLGEAVSQEPEQRVDDKLYQALLQLWQAVVNAAIELATTPQDETVFVEAVREMVERQVSQLNGPRRVLASRLMGGLTHLINLPLMLQIAKEGLLLSPCIAAVSPSSQGDEVIGGQSPQFADTLKLLRACAQSEHTVFISGETGSGKSMLAQRIHNMSVRRNGNFVGVNCASLVSSLWESELFGHVKGAFTGAIQNSLGYVRSAQGGTLFLDEIGESRLEFQARLLTVLQDRIVYPVGSSRCEKVNFRLIAASHMPLDKLQEQGRILPALRHRLQVLDIHLPPLRERREDLPALIEYFLQNACLMGGRTRAVHARTMDILLAYAWPGNVRELMNLMLRVVTFSSAYHIMPEDLPPAMLGNAPVHQGYCLKDAIKRMGIGPRYADKLAVVLSGLGPAQLNNRMLRQALACSESTCKNILRKLCQHGILQAKGQRGGRYYNLANSEKV